MLRAFRCLFAFAAIVSAQPLFLLPDGVVPKKHIIELTIDPDLDTFSGWSRIEIEISKPATTLWVNAKDLTPDIRPSPGKDTPFPRTQPRPAANLSLLNSVLPSAPAPRPSRFSYKRKLTETSVAGPYRNKVDDDWYAFTTFTPIDARRAFPCFDEPRFKTPLGIFHPH